MLKVVASWPDKRLNPNWKRSHHWTTYSHATKVQREEGWAIILEQLHGGVADVAALTKDGRIPLGFHFVPPDRRARDDDNLLGSLKALRDGMAKALDIDDSLFRIVTPTYGAPTKPGRVEITIG